MMVKCEPSKIKQTSCGEALLRFAFGGLITAAAGFLAQKFGPSLAGLFLAFPAILPASVTLVQDHAKKHEQTDEAKKEAGDDSLGASFGSVGLAVFGISTAMLVDQWGVWPAIGTAFVLWLATGIAVWAIYIKLKPKKAERAATSKPAKATSS